MQSIKVKDEFGNIGMLVAVDATRTNPFHLQSLSGGQYWYCRSATAIQPDQEKFLKQIYFDAFTEWNEQGCKYYGIKRSTPSMIFSYFNI